MFSYLPTRINYNFHRFNQNQIPVIQIITSPVFIVFNFYREQFFVKMLYLISCFIM